jgi:hypothetical protein
MKFLLFSYIVLILFITGCDKGIAPETETGVTGFSGTITFSGEWPDSVQRTHLVVFRNPLNSAADFNILNLSYVSKGIPYGSELFIHTSNDSAVVEISAGVYSYIAVAQSKSPELSLNRPDWYVIGVYYLPGDSSKPGSLNIPANTIVNNINIHCDYNNPPQQPPGG